MTRRPRTAARLAPAAGTALGRTSAPAARSPPQERGPALSARRSDRPAAAPLPAIGLVTGARGALIWPRPPRCRRAAAINGRCGGGAAALINGATFDRYGRVVG